MEASDWKALCDRFPAVPAGFEVDTTVAGVPRGAPLVFGERPVIALAFSPDGTRLAVSGGGMIPGAVSIHVYEPESARRVAVCRYHCMGVHDVAFSATGLLASASHDYSVVLWHLEQQDAAFLVGGQHAGVSRSRVVFDGARLLAADGMTWGDERAALHVFDLESGTTDEVLALEAGLGFTHLQRMPESDGLLALVGDMRASRPPQLMRLDGRGRVLSRAAFGHVVHEAHALLGGRVALVGMDADDDTTRVWLADDRAAIVTSRSLGREIGGSLASSPDGAHLAIGYHHGVQICPAADLSPVAHLDLGEHHVTALAWSPDARWIAVGTRERVVRLFEAATGHEHLP